MSKKIHSIILKLASRCNLNCSYCYIYNHEDRSYQDQPRFIGNEVFEATLGAMRDYCEKHAPHQMSLIFHGGEPTLIGVQRFDALAGQARQVLGEQLRQMSIQTNATLLDEQWIDAFRKHGVRVSISLDGPPAIHDAVRVDHKGKGSHAATLAGLLRLQEAGLNPNVLCVINPGQSGLETYRHFRSLGITRMDFLLPDVSHDNKQRFYGKYGPTPVANYLLPILNEWLDQDDPHIKIRLFWGLFSMLLGGTGLTDMFGNPSMSYLIVETNGSIEALDALRVCDKNIAKSGLNVLSDGFDDLERGMPLVHQAIHRGFPLPTACQVCPEREICGGGYLPHRYSRLNQFDNPSVWCADILKLLSHMRRRLEIAQDA